MDRPTTETGYSDGYVNPATRSARAWQPVLADSPDGGQYADGTIPVPPIATSETQAVRL